MTIIAKALEEHKKRKLQTLKKDIILNLTTIKIKIY